MKRNLWANCVCLVALFGTPAASHTQHVTAEQIVAQCAEALGGAAAIDNVRTIRLQYQLPDHSGPARLEIRRPNLLRLGDFAVFDGRRATMLERPPLQDGTERPAEILPEEEWKDFEMQIGWFFPAFFDYPSEYSGIEVIEGIETYKLDVQLPLGARMTYFIDTETHLPLMLESHVPLSGKEHRYSRFFGDYRETAGILYPFEYTYYSFHVREMFTVAIDELEINAHLSEDRFAIPAQLRGGDRR